MKPSKFKSLSVSIVIIMLTVSKLFAQGSVGIDAASSELATYIDPVASMILVIGAIVGLIGGIRVYIKWNSGDQDVQKAIMGWLGSCLFLVTVGIVIKAFFAV